MIRWARSEMTSRSMLIPRDCTCRISSSSTRGSSTTPLPITHVVVGYRMPEGMRWKRNSWPALTTVCPALLPPCERMTISARSERRSMILPFPSSPHWPPTRIVTIRLAPASPVEIDEFRLFVDKHQLELSRWTVAVLGDDDLRDVALVLRDVVIVETLAINEEHQIRVLLQRSRLAKIRELRAMIGSFLRFATQL